MHFLRESVSSRAILSVVVFSLLAACGGEKNPAMSLQFFDRVFVLVDPSMITVQGQDVGRISSSDLDLKFALADADFVETGTAPAIVIYSNPDYIPAGSAYMPIRPRTLYEEALDESEAAGIVVNPNVPGSQSYTMTDANIDAAVARIMEPKPLKFEILVAGG